MRRRTMAAVVLVLGCNTEPSRRDTSEEIEARCVDGGVLPCPCRHVAGVYRRGHIRYYGGPDTTYSYWVSCERATEAADVDLCRRAGRLPADAVSSEEVTRCLAARVEEEEQL